MMDSVLASDLIQLIFRSRLRNHNSDEPVEVLLFNTPDTVVDKLMEYFTGCVVTDITCTPIKCLLEATTNRTVKDKPTHAARLLQELQKWDGKKIAISELMARCELTQSQWKEARKNATVKKFIQQSIQVTRKGKYTYWEKVSA